MKNVEFQLSPISGVPKFLKKFMGCYFKDGNKDLNLQRDLKTFVLFGTP